ncbi:mucin-2-like isoform X2 [Ostrea edulis]|uniref:mucin-2-like isoform X2 n=1 Tax=Ostrea edulis TaxID=37623 RepID=UPI0024AFE1C5|nr:mucin-2-like isoform X2 [Ostrea edulis]
MPTINFNHIILLIISCVYPCLCYDKAKDIIFLLDSSESIGQNVFDNQIIPFVEYFIFQPSLELGRHRTKIGVVGFANGQHIDISLNGSRTKNELVSNLKAYFTFHGGATDTHNALTHIQNELFTTANGDRAAAENVLIIMTDGGSSMPSVTLATIHNLKTQGVSIYVVPVGNCKLYWNEINNMATNAHHVISDLNSIEIHYAAHLLWRRICTAAPVAPMFVPVTTERWTQAPVVPVFHTLLPPSHTPQSRTTSPKHVFAIANINQPSHLPCFDEDPDCASYPSVVCTTNKEWARGSCRKTCLLCEVYPKTTRNPFGFVTLTTKQAFGFVTLTTKQETITPKPTTTTPKPTTTTPKPTTTTPKPTTTTPRPTTTTPKPTTTTPKPTTTTPKPTTTTPKPTTTTPKPTTTTPKPTTTTPKPTTTTPKPTTTTPKPTTTTPKPTTTTPKPTTTTPKPTTSTFKPVSQTGSLTNPTGGSATIVASCDDQDPFCAMYPLSICQQDHAWAFGSCRKTCGLCQHKSVQPKPTTATPTPTTATPKPTARRTTPQRHHYVTI